MHSLSTLDRLNDAAVSAPPRIPTGAVTYGGHGAKTGGLQSHSVGDEYPYMIVGIGSPTEFAVLDTRTSNMSQKFPTYVAAYLHYTSLRVRNLMHS